ncbi:hypothetical protein KL938_005098 [Ogataea parapolymorpha]|nr:hypothetical protein KL938_005098 [Ogataea parapolymorpha]
MENNILSRKLDFDTLVVKYPQLGPYFKGTKYDFRNNDAVIAITEVLLREWGLKVHIHSDRLCPRLFNRLDYLEFMRRLLGSWTNHVGLDVGTGHLAIYALLGAKLFGLQFVGTDIDEKSLELARAIVEQNHLQDKIQLVLTRPQEPLFSRFVELLGSRNGFVVCNPPFYSSFDEMERRAEIKSGPRFPTAAANELVVEGGEVAFVHRMIMESEAVKSSSIRWFSSLIGKYDSLKPLISLLRARKIDNYGVHEPVQQCRASENASRAPLHSREAARADRWAGKCGADQKIRLGRFRAAGRCVVASVPASKTIPARSGSGSVAARKPNQAHLEERS